MSNEYIIKYPTEDNPNATMVTPDPRFIKFVCFNQWGLCLKPIFIDPAIVVKVESYEQFQKEDSIKRWKENQRWDDHSVNKARELMHGDWCILSTHLPTEAQIVVSGSLTEVFQKLGIQVW